MSFKEVKDHGNERLTFEGGGVREASTGKGRFDLLPPEPLMRLAQHYENGAKKYTTNLTIPFSELPSKLVELCSCGYLLVTPTGAITPGVSSEMISQVLSGHSNTCNVRQLQITPRGTNVNIFRTGDRNWEKGLPLSRFIDSAFRHLMQFMSGDRTEDHLAAILWNVAGYMWTERQIQEGKLPSKLNDVPWPPSVETNSTP